MILNLLSNKVMIVLVKPIKVNKVIKRFYPGNTPVVFIPKILSKAIPIIPKEPLVLITKIPQKALVVYNPQRTKDLINNYLYHKQKYKEHSEQFFEQKVSPHIKNLLNQYLITEPSINDLPAMIQYIHVASLNNYKISETLINKFLLKLKTKETLDLHETTLLKSLRKYYADNPTLTIENAFLMLSLWHKAALEFTPYVFVSKESPVEKPLENIILEKDPEEKVSFEVLKIQAYNRMFNITEKMKPLLTEKPEVILKSPLLVEWADYMTTRSSILELQQEEIIINNVLKKVYEANIPQLDVLLQNKKDNKKFLKETSTIPEYLKEDFKEIDQCFLPEDFRGAIQKIKECLELLENNNNVSTIDIKLLAINSTAAVIDDEGTFKLTQEAYQSFHNLSQDLDLKYSQMKPQDKFILDKIKNKEFVILAEKKHLEINALVNSAFLSHKTLVVFDDANDHAILVRLGYLTSTLDNTTILLDEHQKTNPDPLKQSKNQCYRIFSHFILLNKEEESLVVDLETTLLLHNLNSSGDLINQILYNAYDNTKERWANNTYQFPYIINEQFLRKLAIAFYKKNLKLFQEEEEKLLTRLTPLNFKELHDELLDLENKKQKYLQEKRSNQFESLLPKEFQVIKAVNKVFEKIQEKQEEKKNKKEAKKIYNIKLKEKKQQQEEEEKNKPQTAKQKREKYQRAKAKELNSNTNETLS
jgi:hypothetical protein